MHIQKIREPSERRSRIFSYLFLCDSPVFYLLAFERFLIMNNRITPMGTIITANGTVSPSSSFSANIPAAEEMSSPTGLLSLEILLESELLLLAVPVVGVVVPVLGLFGLLELLGLLELSGSAAFVS